MLAASDSISHFAHSPSTLAAFVLLGLLAGVIAAGVPRRRISTLAAGLGLAAVLALTVPPAGGWRQLLHVHWGWTDAPEALRPTRAALSAWHTSGDGVLNVLLFVPFAAALTVLTRRAVSSLVACAALSVGIELYQAASGLRVGSAADVVSNTVGAGLGAVLGVGVMLAQSLGRSLQPADRAPLSVR